MWIIGLLAVYGLIAAVRNISRHSGNAYGQSKDAAVKSAETKAGPGGLSPGHRKAVTRAHRSAYWGREIGQGFPVMRTGWNTGWLAHKTAMAHRQAIGEEALTSNLETEAGRLAALKEHHRRQQIARDEITLICGPTASREEVQEAADNVRYLPRRTPGEGDALDVTDVPGTPDPTRRVDGQSETDADKRFFDHRESGYDGPLDRDGNIPDPDDPENARNKEILDAMRGEKPTTTTDSTSANPTGGTMATAEITYNTAIEKAKAFSAAAEGDVATITQRKAQAMAMADEMQGLEVDSQSLSELMDLIDRLSVAEKALAEVGETAEAIPAGLQARHGGLAEAHQSAPVQAAQREFYEEG